jgi:hypothetical protein
MHVPVKPGYVIYRGPSMLDGAPIVAIATMRSENRKTGDMVQTWILRDDVSPVETSKAGADASICGDCKHRWSLGGACYVNIGQGPGSVWRAYKRGNYADATLRRSEIDGQYLEHQPALADVGRGRKVRLGAYGDPAAVPVDVWRALLTWSAGHAGYTHQWRNPSAAALRSLVMASVDTDAEYADAQSMGWRTFRVRCADDDSIMPREFECVSDTRGTTCADCMACDGAARGPGQASVFITVHGPMRSRFTGA